MVAAYRRPTIQTMEFRDALGEPIPYGRRWGAAGPPSESYSVTTDTERFRPLHVIAQALIEHLALRFDVTVQEDPDFASDLLHAPSEVVRAVRLTPKGSGSQPVTIVFSGFPGIIVCDDTQDFPFPTCGCDACDDSWEDLADELERKLFEIAARWS